MFSGENCRLKWKTVRDSYIKYKRQLKNSDGTKEIDYIWRGNLKFLDNHNVNRRSFRDNVRKQKPEAELRVPDEFIHGIPSSPPPLAPLGSFTMAEVSTASLQPNQDLRINVLDPNPKGMAMDATDLLFLSYSASFKKFPARQQTFMKLELAKLFANAELHQLDDPELYTAEAMTHLPVVIKTEYTCGGKLENSNRF